MNIHSMNNNSFTNLNETIANAYQEAAAESMQNAAADVKLKHTVTDPTVIPYATCRVSLDGFGKSVDMHPCMVW